ncbi:MAG: hypothetical protein KW804_00085 [Candidatus Doudnabacteria bacterium]|nr:hypothetical protein [Candidatus Doudnabacteria bacterium]
MALQGTHIRFALDMKDKYQAVDLAKYLSGTIYPDSRYPLGTDRNLTHPDDFYEWQVSQLSDFKKGWYVHLLYDRIQYKIITQDILSIEGFAPQFSDDWVKLSAIKTLQDLDDVQKFDIRSFTELLNYVENPNNENLDQLKDYNRSIADTYKKPFSIENTVLCWSGFGVSADMVDKVLKQTIAFSHDNGIMSQVKQIYQLTLEKAKNHG